MKNRFLFSKVAIYRIGYAVILVCSDILSLSVHTVGHLFLIFKTVVLYARSF